MKNDLTQEDMKLINSYARRELHEDEIYTFSVTLCDNEVDRDFEAFTKDSLEKLSNLFLGRTGIFDHSMKATMQNARVYKTWVEEMPQVLTSYSEPYCCLKAKAYMIRTAENESLINEIDGGIKKEVSVSCSMEKTVCSVCGKDLRHSECEHIKGKKYAGKLCFGILTEPNDAYEWSFVAVPAQRNAGVTKAFDSVSVQTDAVNIVKNAQLGVVLSKQQVEQIKNRLKFLENFESEAKAYRKNLIDNIKKYALIVMPMSNISEFMESCDCMSSKQLEKICGGLKTQAQNIIPPTIQLGGIRKNHSESYKEYTI